MVSKKFASLTTPVWGMFFLMLLAVLYFAKAIIIPVFLAIFTTFLLNPIVAFIKRKFLIPRPLGAGILLLLFFSSLILAANYLAEPAGIWLDRLPRELKQTEKKLSFVKKSIENVQETTVNLDKIANVKASPNETPAVVVRGPSLFNRVLDGTQSFLIGIVSYIVLIYFLLSFSTALARDIGSFLQNKSYSLALIRIAREAQGQISYYLLVITIINTLLGVSIALIAWATGLPNPLVWGALGAVLNYIPYLGPALNIGIISLVSLLTFNTPSSIILPPLILLVVYFVEGQILQPLTVGKVFTINPVAIFLSILLWGWLWGVAGIFMAVPILMVLIIALQYSNKFRDATSVVCEQAELVRK